MVISEERKINIFSRVENDELHIKENIILSKTEVQMYREINNMLKDSSLVCGLVKKVSFGNFQSRFSDSGKQIVSNPYIS